MVERASAKSETRRSYFASPERASSSEILRAVESISNNEVIDGLMLSVGGLIAVLNEHRQILSVNDSFLKMLDSDMDVDQLLGLRLGEAINCSHASDMPAGCGTSNFCSSCGAAIAIVSGMASGQPEERDCVVETTTSGQRRDLFLRVRAVPIDLRGIELVLLFVRDTTDEQRRASLERVFLHDIGNIIGGLVGTADLLGMDEQSDVNEIGVDLVSLATRLANEFEIHRLIMDAEYDSYRPQIKPVRVAMVLEEIEKLFSYDEVATGKTLSVVPVSPTEEIETDNSLLLRVLSNMVRNAFEGSSKDDEIRLWVESDDRKLKFCVWNHQHIPEEIARRVFQRNFSTKIEAGRGLGTFSMKLLSEQFLNGDVDFTTSTTEGTTFRLHLTR